MALLAEPDRTVGGHRVYPPQTVTVLRVIKIARGGMVVDGFRPDRWDLTGAAPCLLGVVVIMYAPRG